MNLDNSQDSKGNTDLMKAAEAGDDAECRSLLERGADPNIQDNHGETALMYAAENDDEL